MSTRSRFILPFPKLMVSLTLSVSIIDRWTRGIHDHRLEIVYIDLCVTIPSITDRRDTNGRNVKVVPWSEPQGRGTESPPNTVPTLGFYRLRSKKVRNPLNLNSLSNLTNNRPSFPFRRLLYLFPLLLSK